MSPSLADIQTQFAQALRYQASADDCHIVSDHFSAEQRMQVYRNNFVISLSEVLQATYPMLEALVGEECFAGLARQHVLTHPLQEGSVTHYGQGFDQTVNQFPAVIEAAPYASEVARFEWANDLVQQYYANAPSHTYQPLTQLAAIEEEKHGQIILHVKADVIAFDSPYALFALQKAIQTEQFSGLDIHRQQRGVIACNEDGSPWCQTLDLGAYQLLLLVQQNQPLGLIEAPLLAHLNTLLVLDLIAGFTLSGTKENS
ncbi:DNA-binding domain-containing protein [Vibrio aestuarianus]|uniref:HvfC/BufC N-terminal domain-containing protein n=1 Tax=Vibrio aestuarianus TaxID=28171 RepID=UPI00237CAF18|nr:DNA-binding domain-containing protein [Vibrio aestuarianus]MDE1326197.1 DNA-binding domain-containing protein [Vibrio aestuarianus]